MNIEAVIGANYGDEGKGLFTDYLCANRPCPVVIMTNGGSQRGHTVELEDGTWFVFHHFGSGTFRGAHTYFPKQFLLNPMQFIKEHDELVKIGYAPIAYRHPDCILQLPCDIALNWHLEKSKGEKKHGSVGCGIWETKYRMYNNDAWTFSYFCQQDYNVQVKYIKDQAIKYRNIRCAEEKLSSYAEIYDLFMSKGFIDHFIADCMRMNTLSYSMKLNDLVEGWKIKTLVFECGQGLKLDQFYNADDETNTTPSFTGSIGIAQILNDENIKDANVNLNYVSRTYLTKHGAGKFEEQERDFVKSESLNKNKMLYVPLEYDKIQEDKTNIENEWQDSLRFAKLDYDELFKRCNDDIAMFNKLANGKLNASKHIVMTHCNEIDVPEKHYSKIDCMSDSKYSSEIKTLKADAK